ncbi:hypothetical protein MNBD_GAMMA12-3532 [hydrothermal vent metagenome]|uniref:Uncharacterized protein n=1 Tax=hydrothermal vent metagenome TaxID=652676 RepID=A0A3B0YCX8_9ZZZZ
MKFSNFGVGPQMKFSSQTGTTSGIELNLKRDIVNISIPILSIVETDVLQAL